MERFKILCPFCSAPYDSKMMVELESGSSGCRTCGPGPASAVIEIFCSNCNKLVYKKEGYEYDSW